MKTNTLIISALLFMAGLLVWTTGCKKDDGPDPDFLIKIDSMVFQDTIRLDDTLSVKFYGYIGPNSCYSFNHFEQLPRDNGDLPNSMKFKVWGKHEDNGNCYDALMYLDGAEISITGFLKGNFNIFVVQPDGTIMNGVVFVEE
jgi:hypothetical protein